MNICFNINLLSNVYCIDYIFWWDGVLRAGSPRVLNPNVITIVYMIIRPIAQTGTYAAFG